MPTSNTHIPHTPSPATQLGSPTFQNPESKTPNRQIKPNLKWLQNFHPINHNSTTALLHHQITQMMPLPTELQKPKPKPPTPQQTKPLHNPNNHTENKNLSPSLPLSFQGTTNWELQRQICVRKSSVSPMCLAGWCWRRLLSYDGGKSDEGGKGNGNAARNRVSGDEFS